MLPGSGQLTKGCSENPKVNDRGLGVSEASRTPQRWPREVPLDPRSTCKIDFCVNDQLTSVTALLERLEKAVQDRGPGTRSIDLGKCQYLGPDATVLLAAAVLEMRRTGQRPNLIHPDGPAELRAFWRFSGLQELQTQDPADKPGDPPDGRPPTVMPIRRLETATFNDADPVIKLAQLHTELSRDSEEELRVCVNEVVQNIEDHSESLIGGVMSARFIEYNQQVRVAIVDRGVGICTTLKKRFDDVTPKTALQRVIKGEYTALSRPNNLGLGISNLWNIVRRLRGDIFIVSQDAAIESRAGNDFPARELPCRYNGTGVFFTLPVVS
jgi:hypothetical protein